MRTNIVIDDELMAQALKASGAKTRKEAVELGLKTRQPAGGRCPARAQRACCTPWSGPGKGF